MNASKLIDKQIADLGDWRGIVFARLRKLILAADPDIIEEWKWNTAVWTHSGMVCAVGGFKDHVKMNFFKGASLEDPRGLFNAGLEAKATRAIDFHDRTQLANDGFVARALLAQGLSRLNIISFYGRLRMNIRLGRIHQRRSIPDSIPVVRGAKCCPWHQRTLRLCRIHRPYSHFLPRTPNE
jgi:hypothetical protein